MQIAAARRKPDCGKRREAERPPARCYCMASGNSSEAISLSLYFWTLPLAVMG